MFELLKTSAALGYSPTGLGFDGKNVWVSDFSNQVLKVYNRDFVLLKTSAALGYISRGLGFEGRNVWVADGTSQRLRVYDRDFVLLKTSAALGYSLLGLGFDGRNVWIADGTSQRLRVYDRDFVLLKTSAALGYSPRGLGFEGKNIWVSDASNQVLKVYNRDFVLLKTSAALGYGPTGLGFEGKNIWVSDLANQRLRVYNRFDYTVAPPVYAELTVAGFQANAATGTMESVTLINDGIELSFANGGLNQYAEIDLGFSFKFTQYRQYGNSSNVGDGVFEIEYWDGEWHNWIAAQTNHNVGEWLGWVNVGEVIGSKIRITCVSVDTSGNSRFNEIEVKY